MRIKTKIPLLALASLIAVTGFPDLTTQQEAPQKAKAADAKVREAEAYSIADIDKFNAKFSGIGKKYYDHVGGEKIDLGMFHYRIDGHKIAKRDYKYDKKGNTILKGEWTEIDLWETMDGEKWKPEDMAAGKAKTPYRYYITYKVSPTRKQYSIHGGTEYEVFSTKPISTCDTDSEGYPANKKKFNATQYKGKDGIEVTGTYYNFNAVNSQLKGIYSFRQGKHGGEVVHENATRSLWDTTGVKVNGVHYHVIIKIIDAKKFWKECCKPKSESFKSYNGVMYMNPVMRITEDKENGWTKVIDTGLNTLAKYYDKRVKRIDTSGRTCRNLKDMYNWKVTFVGPSKYDVTFEKYLCKSGNGLDGSYTSKNIGKNNDNLFSSTTMKGALKPNCAFKIKGISETKIPDKSCKSMSFGL